MPNQNTTPALDSCWSDEREQAFNLEIHQLLNDAAAAIDRKGPLKCVNATLPIVEKIVEKLIKERDRRTGGNVVEIRSKKATEAELRETITQMDMRSQEAFTSIAALASVIVQAIDKTTDELRVSAQRSALLETSKAVRLIRYMAHDAENDINGEAEKVGCNYVDS